MLEAQAVELIKKEFSGTVEVPRLDNLPQIKNMAKSRLDIKAEIGRRGLVPFYGPSDARFAVLGGAPGFTETRTGKPFVGPGGKLMHQLIEDIGVDPNQVFWTYVVGKETIQGGATRPPTDEDIRENMALLKAQLMLTTNQKVLLCGETALRAFRPDLIMARDHGKTFLWDSKWVVMPIADPSDAINKRAGILSEIQADLDRWTRIIKHTYEWNKYLGMKCVECEGHVAQMDRDGLAFCQQHWDGGESARTARNFWRQQSSNQLELL